MLWLQVCFILETVHAFKLQALTESRNITLSPEVEQSDEFWHISMDIVHSFCACALFGVFFHFRKALLAMAVGCVVSSKVPTLILQQDSAWVPACYGS